ncbi:unnamed protein product [Ilex paraguariensis]|uniref:Uncharacterized protein n=1 Tax=Ilex paraguariensis TaxID=185542 RepID=A0ABC8UGV2_9AQUA
MAWLKVEDKYFYESSFYFLNLCSWVWQTPVPSFPHYQGAWSKEWILNNLNASRLVHYFMFLAILSSLNFIFYLVVTKFYQYKAEVSDSMEVLKGELEGSKVK